MSARGRVSSPPARRASAAKGEETPPSSPGKLATNGRRVSGKQSPPAPWWCLNPLSLAGLEAIATHQYKGGKYTPLDNLLNPFWINLTNMLPLWVAPNLITFTGLVPLGVVYGLTCYYTPSAEEPNPSWLLIGSAFTLFFYQTLDAMDGKQARRTGSSTPLGQLFDHGCDCLASIAHTSQAVAVVAPGGTLLGLLAGTLFQFGFFLAQWEEYHTGVLQTSAGPVGVTETQYFLMLASLGGGLIGHERLSAALVNPNWAPFTLPKHDTFLFWCIFVSLMICTCFNRTFQACWKKGTMGLACVQLVPVLVIQVAAVAIHADTRAKEQKMVALIVGMHMFFITEMMILFSMAHQVFPPFQPHLVPLVALAWLTHNADLATQHAWMVVWSSVFAAYLLWWNVSVIRQITSKLKIEVFRIKPVKPN